MKKITHFATHLLLSTLLISAFHFSVKANVDTVYVGPNNGFTFSPSSFTMNLGDTVLWIWSSGNHTTTSTNIPSGATTWDSPMTSNSTSFMYIPAVVGAYNYVCTPHSSFMTGSFTVVCQLDTSVNRNGNTLTAVSNQGRYRWVNCDSNYTGNAADTSQNFTPTQSGNYALILSNGSCTDTSSCYNVSVTSIVERDLAKPLRIAPNPVKYDLELINFRAADIQQLRVYNLSGQLVLSETGGYSNTKIDVSQLVNGIYFIEILADDERYLSKFIKQ